MEGFSDLYRLRCAGHLQVTAGWACAAVGQFNLTVHPSQNAVLKAYVHVKVSGVKIAVMVIHRKLLPLLSRPSCQQQQSKAVLKDLCTHPSSSELKQVPHTLVATGSATSATVQAINALMPDFHQSSAC